MPAAPITHTFVACPVPSASVAAGSANHSSVTVANLGVNCSRPPTRIVRPYSVTSTPASINVCSRSHPGSGSVHETDCDEITPDSADVTPMYGSSFDIR